MLNLDPAAVVQSSPIPCERQSVGRGLSSSGFRSELSSSTLQHFTRLWFAELFVVGQGGIFRIKFTREGMAVPRDRILKVEFPAYEGVEVGSSVGTKNNW
jgi:hypothetical protein